MNLEQPILLFFITIFNVRCDTEISDEDYQKLPAIFRIDPYTKCLEENKKYCKVTINLNPQNDQNPSGIWRLIETRSKSKQHYNHAVLYHAICVDDFCKKNYSSTNISMVLEQCYNENYKENGIVAKISTIDCNNYDNIYKIVSFDLVCLCLFGGYILLSIWATLYDLKTQKCEKPNKYLINFSAIRNWKKIQAADQNAKFQKLTFVQGIRFYTTVLIILCHTFCSYTGGYVEDTKYLEDISKNPLRHLLRNLFVFLVQTFFLLSAWFLSYHSFQIFHQPRKVNLFKYITLTFFNRYLRIILPVTVMILIARSTFIYSLFYGPVKDLYSDVEYQRCQKYWWFSLACINNQHSKDMCYFITWYLSADTQLYLFSLIVLTLAWKFPKNIQMIFSVFTFAGIAISATVAFIYELDVIFNITPRSTRLCIFNSFQFYGTYSSTYSNMATYMLGLAFGYIYFKFEKTKDFHSFKSIVAKWWTISVIFPLASIILAGLKYNPATSALLSATLKPMYALGIGISILGMSQEANGIWKRFFEWRPVVFCGNFTYCTYLVQFIIIFQRTALVQKPMRVSDFILFSSFIQDVTLSFLTGFLIHMFVELPVQQLQTLLVPNIRIKRCKNV